MEDHGFQPEDEELTENTPSRNKRRGADFLSQYIFRRQRLAAPEHDDDTAEDTAVEVPTPRRGFFSKIFKGVVEPPTREASVDASTDSAFDTSLWYSWQTPDRLTTTTQVQPESPKLPDTSALFHYEEVPTTLGASDHVSAVDDALVMDQLLSPPVENSTTFERSRPVDAQPAIPVALPEVTPGHLSPAALVGAEQFARRFADKRLEKKITQETKKAEAKHAKAMQVELAKLVQQNQQQLEALRRDRTDQVAAPPVERAPKEPEAIVVRTPELVRTEPVEQVGSKAVFERVVDAAEHNRPVERAYERSHEIKDEPVLATNSVGAVLAASQPTTRQQASIKEPAKKQIQDAAPLTPEQLAQIYQRSMQTGFYSALAIIIFGVIAYLVK